VLVDDASQAKVGDRVAISVADSPPNSGKIIDRATIVAISITDSILEKDIITLSADAIQAPLTPVYGEEGMVYIPEDPNIPVRYPVLVATQDTETIPGAAGKSESNRQKALSAKRNGVVKNFMAASYFTEEVLSRLSTTSPGTVQSSALVMTGPQFDTSESPRDFLSYVYKSLDTKYSHFGTRLRVIGRISGKDNTQSPYGSTTYYNASPTDGSAEVGISGGSGGIAIMVDPETNNGYYLELIPLTALNLEDYSSSENIHNIVFYKIERNASSETNDTSRAVPIKLWGGQQKIVVDDGLLVGQGRTYAEENPSVYDLAIEYVNVGKARRFSILLNDKIIATVDDEFPIDGPNNFALFVRGSSRVMFENVYAITNNYANNTVAELEGGISEIFTDEPATVDRAFKKYAMSGVVQNSYLSGISSATTTKFNMYFEEFGTIMREAAYFNVRYDKAYPALYAELFPTISDVQGYTIGGFMAGAYGAEFIVFNNTDSVLSLDSTSANYLRIQGITFTQQSENELTLDEFLKSNGDFSRIEPNDTLTISNINIVKKTIEDVRSSRVLYGRNQFALNATYIQSLDAASELMAWMLDRIMKPRRSVGVEIFATPTIQLGDILSVSYKDKSGTNQISSENSRFVVYSIEYTRSGDGPSMTVYLSEVV
jgi:hypothetical protein